MAALIAVGVDNPTAHGQAISNMVMARRTSRVRTRVSAASANDAGTNRREKFSPTVWIGARWSWACSTWEMIRPMVVSLPTAVARMTRRPRSTTEPAWTRWSTEVAIGSVSPVIAD